MYIILSLLCCFCPLLVLAQQPDSITSTQLQGRWRCVMMELVQPTGSKPEPVPTDQQDILHLQPEGTFVQEFVGQQRGGRWLYLAASRLLVLTDTDDNQVSLTLLSFNNQTSMLLEIARYDTGTDTPKPLRLHYVFIHN